MTAAVDVVAGEQTLARSFLYRILGSLLRYPTSAGIDVGFLDEGAREALRALGEGAGKLDSLFAELRSCYTRASTAQIEDSYVKLFGHTVGGVCPPYESEYGETQGMFQMPHELSDISAFYRAFGMRILSDRHERVDHVAVECEFMHFLAFKQAYAEENGMDEMGAATLKAQVAFMRDHLGRWAPAFFRRVVHADDGGVYSVLSRFGLAFIKDDCARLGVEPGSEKLRLIVRTETRDDVFECGSPTDCPDGGKDEDGAFRV